MKKFALALAALAALAPAAASARIVGGPGPDRACVTTWLGYVICFPTR